MKVIRIIKVIKRNIKIEGNKMEYYIKRVIGITIESISSLKTNSMKK